MTINNLNETEITNSMFQTAKETTLLLLEHRIKNHQDLVNGYEVGSREYGWTEFFITGVEIRKAGGELPAGTNEKTQRGYKCQADYEKKMQEL